MPGFTAPFNAATGSPAAGMPFTEGVQRGVPRVAAELPVVTQPQRVGPFHAKELTKVFFERLNSLTVGTPQHQYVRNTLIEMNMSLVRFASKGFRSRTGSDAGTGAEMEDIIQAGTIGLIKAIDRFEPERGVAFSSLALPYITG